MNKYIAAFKVRYQNMTLPVKAGFWFTVCTFLQKGIMLITMPIFTRVLSETEYGILSTYNAWQLVLTLLITLTLYRSLMNLYIKYEDKEEVLSAICGLSLLITISWAVVGICFSAFLSRFMLLSQGLIICLFTYPVGEGIIQCWMMYKRYIYDYKRVIAVSFILTTAVNVLGLACVLFIRPTAFWKIVPQNIVYLILGAVLFKEIFHRCGRLYHGGMWAFSLSFCVGLMPHYFSEFILQSSDKIMINYMCGSRDVAIYSIAYTVGSLINLFASAVNGSFAPYQYQKIQAGEFRQLSRAANIVLGGLGIILFLLMLFRSEIVLLFGGRRYLECTAAIIPICIGVYFNYMFQLFARAQEYYNRKLTIVIPSVVCAALNIVLNYIFIKIFGYIAAAYTTFFCFAVFCFIHYLFYKKLCREVTEGKEFYDGRMILRISLGVILGGIMAAYMDRVFWLKYVLVLAAAPFLVRNRKGISSWILGKM